MVLTGRIVLKEEPLLRGGVVSNVIDSFIACILGLADLEPEEFTERKDASKSERIVTTL